MYFYMWYISFPHGGRWEGLPLVEFGQSSSFGKPFVFFSGLQMSIVKVVLVMVEGECCLLVITDIGEPRAKTSKDCLLSRMSEQSRSIEEMRVGRRIMAPWWRRQVDFRNSIVLENVLFAEWRDEVRRSSQSIRT